MFLKKYVTKAQHDIDFSELVLQYHELEKQLHDLKEQFDGDVREELEAESRAQKEFADGMKSLTDYNYTAALKSQLKSGE